MIKTTHAYFNKILNNSQGGSVEINQNIQTNKLSFLSQKLLNRQPIKIVYQGDSTVYGQDTVSVDKISASGVTDSGVAHTFTRASKQTPESLQGFLRMAYNNNNITVINKGHSGDWADLSYQYWTKNENADLAIVQLGGNDMWLNASWVPDDIERNLNAYCSGIRRLVQRFHSWGTPVILHAPLKIREQELLDQSNGGIMPELARIAIFNLGIELQCPVIDLDDLFSGCDYTYWCDTVHLNGKGYEYLASRLASYYIAGATPSIPKIQGGLHLGTRSSREMIINNGASYSTHATSSGTEEGPDGQGVLLAIPNGANVYYGFEALEENLILIPILSLDSGAGCKITLDFGVEQASYTLSQAMKSTPNFIKPLSEITVYTSSSGSRAYDSTINRSTTDRYLQINQKGLHNLKIEAINGTVYFNGFLCMSNWSFV